MAMKLVPPPPPEPAPEDVVAKQSSRLKVWTVLILCILGLGALVWLFEIERQPPEELTQPVVDRSGPPAVRLEPSLIVPGPMQLPHAAREGDVARPDEAIIFRADITGTGYVFLAIELPDGQLVKLHTTAANRPLSGSQLLTEDQYTVAYPLEKHKGQSVTFVAALSLTPWLEAPARLPSSPRVYPARATGAAAGGQAGAEAGGGTGSAPVEVGSEAGAGSEGSSASAGTAGAGTGSAVPAASTTAGPIPGSPLLSWDRFTVSVAREIPPPPTGEPATE